MRKLWKPVQFTQSFCDLYQTSSTTLRKSLRRDDLVGLKQDGDEHFVVIDGYKRVRAMREPEAQIPKF